MLLVFVSFWQPLEVPLKSCWKCRHRCSAQRWCEGTEACRAIGTHSRQPVTSCFPFPILLILLFICCLHLLIVPNVYRTIKQYPTFTSFLHSPSATIYVCFLQAAKVLEREKYIFPHINTNHSFPSPLESGFFFGPPYNLDLNEMVLVKVINNLIDTVNVWFQSSSAFAIFDYIFSFLEYSFLLASITLQFFFFEQWKSPRLINRQIKTRFGISIKLTLKDF